MSDTIRKLFMQRSESGYLKHFNGEVCKSGRSSLFDMEFGEVMIMQDSKELLPAKLEHISVSFELEHAAS